MKIKTTSVSLSFPGPVQTPVPAWLQGKKVLEWVAIASTRQIDSPLVLSDLVAAGLTDGNWRDVGYGTNPLTGTFTFSGGALRRTDSMLMSFGGGGRTWGGNEVRALPLQADAPRWFCLVKPSKASGVWTNASNSRAFYNPDGTPVSRHSYCQAHHNAQRNELMVYGCGPVWPIDQGKGWQVDAVPLATGGPWYPAGHYAPMSNAVGGYEGNWVAHDAVTGDAYVPSSHRIQLWSNATGAPGAILIDTGWVDVDRGCALIDSKRKRLVRVGPRPNMGASQMGYFDLAASPVTYRDVTTSMPLDRASGAGFVHDTVLDKYLYFPDQGVIYAIDPVSFAVSPLATTGTAPVPSGAGVNGGETAIMTRMQHVPNLRGVVIAQAWDKPVYFLRTA